MLHVTADSNVFISALNFDGKPLELLNLARDGVISLAMSDPVMAEIKRVLRDKFKWPDEDLAFIERHIRSFTQHVEPSRSVEAIEADPTDNRILECAQASGSAFIISGDKHLLSLGRFGSAQIVKVADFLDSQGRSGANR